MGRSSSAIWLGAWSTRCRERCWPSSSARPNQMRRDRNDRVRRDRVRIVAGRHRGRRLLAPTGETVRPTSDRAREALFNILSHGHLAAAGIPFAEAAVLDAFAGTGALGLEALSRGPAEALFIAQDPHAPPTLPPT